jgi:hypothetical protein
MRKLLSLVLGLACSSVFSPAQSAEELINKNLEAKGGLAAIKAITSLRMMGRLQQGTFVLPTEQDAKAPDKLRQTFTLQGMTDIECFDGTTAWHINPFQGRRDPELMGEDDQRDISEQADFYGPLVDYQSKGNHIEYLGKYMLDGDDTYRLKVTLKNGDIVYYYLDPDTYIEVRTEKQMFVRGAVHETVNDLGSYKKVAGVYFPFSVDSWPKNDPSQKQQVTYDKIEANVTLEDSTFRMPAAQAAPSVQDLPEPPAQKKQEPKPPPKPPQKP